SSRCRTSGTTAATPPSSGSPRACSRPSSPTAQACCWLATTPTEAINTMLAFSTRRRTLGVAAVAAAVTAADQFSKATASLVHGQVGALLHPAHNAEFSLQIAHASRWVEVTMMASVLVLMIAIGLRAVRAGNVAAWPVGL